LEEDENLRLKCVCNSKSDLNEVWKDEQVKAVVIATPNETHYPIVKSALINGKSVLSEKPLALKLSECEELSQIASDNGLVLLVEYVYTFSPGLKQAQSMIENGEIGRVLGIEMEVRHLGRFKGGSVYWLLGSHMLSVLDMFTPIKELSFKKEDLVIFNGAVETGIISFKNANLSGRIVVSLNYPGKESRIIIYGETGTVIYNPVIQPTLQIENYERIKWTVADLLPRKHREFRIDESNNLYYVIEHFGMAAKGQAEGNAERAVNITKILEGLQSN